MAQPHVLEYAIYGWNMTIGGDAYERYARLWEQIAAGKVLLQEEEYVPILMASGLPNSSVTNLCASAREAYFGDNGSESIKTTLSSTAIGWRIFMVLLNLCHEASRLDLHEFLQRLEEHESETSSMRESAITLPYYSAIENFQPRSPISQNPKVENSTEQDFLAELADEPPAIHSIEYTVKYSRFLDSPLPVANNREPPKNTIKKAPPRIPPKPTNLSSKKSVKRPQPTEQAVADGYNEYLDINIWPPTESRRASAPAEMPVRGARTRPPIPRGSTEPNITHLQDAYLDENGSSKKFSSANIGEPKYLSDPARAMSHHIESFADISNWPIPVDTDEPILEEPSALLSPTFISHGTRRSADLGRSNGFAALQGPHRQSSNRLSLQPDQDLLPQFTDRFQGSIRPPARTSPSPSHSLSSIPETGSVNATSEAQLIARNRLIALKDREPLKRRSSILGLRIKTVEPEFSLSILAQAMEDAAKEGNLPVVTQYLLRGADPNYRSKPKRNVLGERHSALQIAATGGFSEIVDLLVFHGADKSAINNALVHASLTGHVDLAIRLISEHKADVDFTLCLPFNHSLPAHVSTQHVTVNALASAADIIHRGDRIRFLEFLISQNCNVNGIIWKVYKAPERQEFGFGYSSIALFALTCPTCVDLLLTAGAPAHTIRQEPVENVVEQFQQIGYRCDNMSIVQPISCIDWEADSNVCLPLLIRLVDHGNDPSRAEVNGIQEQVTELGWKRPPLARAIRAGNVEGINWILELGASADSQFNFGDFVVTPEDLHFLKGGVKKIGKAEKFAKSKFVTALSHAAQYGILEITQALLRHGADVNAASDVYHPRNCQSPETAMAKAASHGHLEIVECLLNAGANANDGSLHRAALNAELDIVLLLLRCGAKLDHKVDSVIWPNSLTSSNDSRWKSNPDVNRVRRPRGDVLCFAMFWSLHKPTHSADEKDKYLAVLRILINAYEEAHLLIQQDVLRAALDNNNVLGLKALFELTTTKSHPALQVSSFHSPHNAIYYIWSKDGLVSKNKNYHPFTPAQYALMMYCDQQVVDLLVQNKADVGRHLGFRASNHEELVRGTALELTTPAI